MLYTKSLLNTYMQVDIDADTIAEQLTLRTCEVEEVVHRTIPDLVVIGYVTERTQHPDSKKLSVCQVDAGLHGTFQICCGASNVDAGMYIAAALPGCHLPEIDLTIGERDLGGVASNGMICSKQELGIAEDLEDKWIWVLKDTRTDNTRDPQGKQQNIDTCFADLSKDDCGISLGTKYPWLHSWVIDVENKTITHRPDMRGHFGLAVELGAISSQLGWTYTRHDSLTSLINDGKDTDIQSYIQKMDKHSLPVQVTAQSCNIYGSIHIDISALDIKHDMPTRLQLLELGLAPRSFRVDQSNLWMQQTGHPIHFFDADTLEGGLTIRYAQQGEEFTDLFEKTHTLNTSDLVIADDKKICALAGIVGGLSTGITDTTTSILAECAHFDPVVVRKTGTRLGLRTDAELRFEKYIHPHWTLVNIKQLATHIESLGAKIHGTHVYISPEADLSFPHISMDLDTSFGAISPDFDASKRPDVDQILQDLGCIYQDGKVVVPGRRGPEDLTIPADIVEEVSRMYGFDKIGTQELLDTAKFVQYTDAVQAQRSCESLLADRHGFYEMETYPWITDKQIENFGLDISTYIPMHNPVSSDQRFLRDTLRRSLLDMCIKNNAFFDHMKIFDIGPVWKNNVESTSLCLVISTKSTDWKDSAVLQAKHLVDELLKSFPVKGRLQYIDTKDELYHPFQQADIRLNNQPIGSVSRIHAYILESLKLDPEADIVVLELDISALIAMKNQQKKKGLAGASSYNTLQDHIVTRDLAFVIGRDEAIGDVVAAIKKVKAISDVNIFDIYAGEHIAPDRKSIAVKFSIVSQEAMKTDEINSIMDQAIEQVKKVGGELRG